MCKSEVVIVMRESDKKRLMDKALDLMMSKKSFLWTFIDDGFRVRECPKKGYGYLRWYNVNWDREKSKGVKFVMDFLNGLDEYDFYRLGNNGYDDEIIEKGKYGLVNIERRLNMKQGCANGT